MGRTNVPVRDETWERLNGRKSRGDTFDDVISRLLDATSDNGSATDSIEQQIGDVSDQAREAEAGGDSA